MKGLLHRIPDGTWWMLYSYLLGFGAQGLYVLVLARTLGAYQYGLFAGALALVTMLAALAGLGAGNVLVMETARDQARYPAQLGTALTYLGITLLPLAGFAVTFSWISSVELLPVLAPLILSELFFVRAYDFGLQSFQSHGELRNVAHFNVAASLSRLGLALTFAYFGGEDAAQWSWLYASVTVLIAIVILAVCIRRFGAPRIHGATLGTTWRIGIFFALGMASRSAINDADKFVLASVGMSADGGQYTASHRLVNMAFAPIQAMTYSSNATWFRDGLHGFEAVWRSVRRILPLVGGYVLVAVAVLTAALPIAIWLLGDGYYQVATMMPLLSLTLIGQALYTVFGDALMGVGRQRARSIAQAVVAVVVTAANLILVPRFGWHASAAIAITASLFLGCCLAAVFFYGLLRERRKDSE